MKKLLFILITFLITLSVSAQKEITTFDVDTVTNTGTVTFQISKKLLDLNGSVSFQVTSTRLSGTTGYKYQPQYSNDATTWINWGSSTTVTDTNAIYSFMSVPSAISTASSAATAIDTAIVATIDTAFAGNDTSFVFTTTSTITNASTTTTTNTETAALPSLYTRLSITGDSTQSVKVNVVGLYKTSD